MHDTKNVGAILSREELESATTPLRYEDVLATALAYHDLLERGVES